MSQIKVNEISDTGGYSMLGRHNRIINGAMMIDQRNAGASVPLPAATDKWIADRWVMQSQGGGTGQRISATIAMGSPYSLKYTSTTSSAFFQMGQQIEYLNMSDFQSQTITISFWAKANNSNTGSTNFVVRTRTSTTPDAGIRFSGANSDTSVTISTTAQRYQVTRSIASGVSALSIEFVLGSHVSGDGFEITGVQVEKGNVATPFEFRQYGHELALCQRYFVSLVMPNGGYWYNLTNGVYRRYSISFPVVMRTTPSGTVAGAQVNSTPGSPNVDAISNQGAVVGLNGSAASDLVSWNASGLVTASAEL